MTETTLALVERSTREEKEAVHHRVRRFKDGRRKNSSISTASILMSRILVQKRERTRNSSSSGAKPKQRGSDLFWTSDSAKYLRSGGYLSHGDPVVSTIGSGVKRWKGEGK